MRALRVFPVLAVIMIAMTIGSVFAVYNFEQPILGTTGQPALSGNQFTGIINVLYADGMPVVLSSNKANLQLCVSSCIVEQVTLKQTAPGTYAYSFTPPSSLNGTITISVLAGSLADDNGRIFPSVNTQIGTYATPGLASASSPANALSGQPLPANPMPQSNSLAGQAVAVPQQPSQDSTTIGVVLTVTIILLAAGALLILPSRRR